MTRRPSGDPTPRPGTSGGAPPSRPSPAVALAIVALAAAVYARSLGGGFLNWDDDVYVTRNPELALPFGEAVRSVLTTFVASNWNPLHRLTHLLEWHVFGANAAAFRATNLVLHAATAVVVLHVLHEWLRDRVTAAFAAALFAVHPANVENVAWISERKTLLASLLGFLAVLAWLRAGGPRGRVVALVLLAAGLLAKTSIVVLPALLVLLDLSLRRRPAWGWAAAAAAVGVPAAWVQVEAASAAEAIRPLHGGSVPSHLATCVAAIPGYAASVVAPFGLVPRHRVEPVASPLDARFLLGVVLLALVAWGTWRSWRGARRFLVAGPWFLVSVLLTVVVPIPIVLADRYLYLSIPFLAGAACARLGVASGGAHRTARLAAAAAVGVLAVVAAGYAADWRTSVTLWTRQVARVPGDADAWHSLAVGHMTEARDPRAARPCFERAVALDPGFADAREGLALLDVSEGRAADAERAMTEIVRATPRRPLAWSVLAAAQEVQGRREDALRTLEEGLRHVPSDRDLALNLARVRERMRTGAPPPR